MFGMSVSYIQGLVYRELSFRIRNTGTGKWFTRAYINNPLLYYVNWYKWRVIKYAARTLG